MATTMPVALDPRIRTGDPVAVNDWLGRHQERLKRFVRYDVRVPSGPYGSASDVFQNAGPHLLADLPDSVTTDAELLRLVRHRLRRRALDLIRRNAAHTTHPLAVGGISGSGAAAVPAAPNVSSPSLRLTRDERREYILITSGYQPDTPDHAVSQPLLIVLLRQVDDVPLKVIADGLGIDCVKAARRYYRALDPLQAGLHALWLKDRPAESDTAQDKLYRALPQLSEKERKAAELCRQEDEAYPGVVTRDCRYTLAEAGKVIGASPAAVGTHLFRGRKRLRKIMLGCDAPTTIPTGEP